MALIVEAVGQSGVVERISVEGGAAVINAQPGLTYRILDESGRPLNASATVRRVGDHLIIEGLPGEATVQLNDFFFVCTPNDPCSLDLEGLGGVQGETISQVSEPVAALADGSFVLHAPDSMATPTAPEAEFSGKPALAGLALLALAGGGGGGGGGGSDGPPPPPAGSTTVTSPPFTNDTTPVIAGKAVPGAQITVTLDIPGSGPVTFNTVADGNGDWSVDTGSATPIAGAMPAAGLPLDAPTTVRVLTAGSTEPITYQLSMDLVPPAAPVIQAVTGDDLINADEAREANPSPVTVQGTAEPGSAVTVSWHGDDQVTTADAEGNWAVTFNGQEIPDGDYIISAVATDVAGNTGAASTRPVTVATGRPSAPNFDDVAGDNIINAAESAGDLVITGTTSAGTEVLVSLGEVVIDRQATVTGTDWSVTISAAELAQLQDGQTYRATAYASDGVNRSVVGASDPVVVDRTPPGPPQITTADDLLGASGGLISGTAEAGGTVQVSLGGVILDPVNVNQGGNWTVVVGAGELPADGDHTINAVAIDAAGNASVATSRPVTVDTTVATPTPVLASDTGSSGTDGITRDGTVTVSGIEAGATWEYSTDSGANWTAGSGTSFTLPAGTYTAGAIQVRQTDLAGNLSGAGSNAAAIVVDTTAPPAPSISLTEDTGAPGDGITSNGSVSVGGLEAGAAWQYSIDGGTSWTAGSGTSFNLPNGTYAAGTVQAQQVDLAGNPSGIGSIEIEVQVDANPPPAPPPPALASDTGVDPDDGITSVGTMNVTGIVGVSWQYSTDSGDTWSAPQPNTTTSFTLDPGSYLAGAVLVRQTNSAGLTSGPSIDAGPIDVDVAAPTLQIVDNFPDPQVADDDIVFTFTFNEAVVNFDLGDLEIQGAPAGSTPSLTGPSELNSYQLTVPLGVDQSGTVSVTVRADTDATDLAGNRIPSGGSASQGYDTTRIISIESLFDDDASDEITGLHEESPAAANDATPTLTIGLSGDLLPGEIVHIHRNGGDIGVATQSGSEYSFTDTTLSPVTASSYTYTAHIYSGATSIAASTAFVYNFTPTLSP